MPGVLQNCPQANVVPQVYEVMAIPDIYGDISNTLHAFGHIQNTERAEDIERV